jgi:dihydrofolate reductase
LPAILERENGGGEGAFLRLYRRRRAREALGRGGEPRYCRRRCRNEQEAGVRKVTYGGACSADGYIAGPGEAMDWIRMSDDASAIMAESWKGVDTILMGRKTYEFALKMGGGPATPGITSYVFSRTMTDRPKAAELVSGDAVEFVRGLKARPGGDIILMGGGELGSALIAGRVVDEIGVSMHPLLLGGGTPLFQPVNRRVELELIDARAISQGCVFVRWRVLDHP